ncbi:ABC transporter [Bacillus sp. SA1-12]|uniref:DUF3189 family protein n=1 Tax=Bacillus sp. SA1-12 TaxID=1455638 RepID=UPI000626F185|nr:DUF3189 family protein [Bacillus sp. SA1-12]KKI90373.1 ABC transporter [Bacillus sp. SA1-12]
MIYIYNDFGGTHTTALAAAYHLNILKPSTKTLTKEEILAVPFFNQLTKQDSGKIIFHGIDDDGHSVYTIGRRSSKLVVPALKDLYEILNNKYPFDERIIFSNTSPTVPFAMTMGGFFSRGLKIDVIGVPLLVRGAQQCCGTIYQLVETTKKIAKEKTDQKIITLENQTYKA